MKRFILLILVTIFLFSLTACCRGELQKTETEIVEAVVTNVWRSRGGNGVTVEYGGARNDIVNSELYAKYQNNLGSTVTCYLIIRTYEHEVTKQLVYNSDLNVIKDNN